jgi:hypothetical protein
MQCLCLSKLINRVQFGCNLHLQPSSKCSLLRCKPDFGTKLEDIYLFCLCAIYCPQGWLMFHTIGDRSGTCIFLVDRTEEWTAFANLKLGTDKGFILCWFLTGWGTPIWRFVMAKCCFPCAFLWLWKPSWCKVFNMGVDSSGAHPSCKHHLAMWACFHWGSSLLRGLLRKGRRPVEYRASLVLIEVAFCDPAAQCFLGDHILLNISHKEKCRVCSTEVIDERIQSPF